ncbi:phosphonate ABC transporter, permease protein PhnE [Thermocrinis sp.]
MHTLTESGKKSISYLLWLSFLFVILLSFKISRFDIPTLVEGLSNSLSLIKEMFPPDFSGWRKILILSFETISIGLWGTLLGILLSIPLGFLSARNTSPNLLVYNLSRFLVSFLRSIPDVLYALIFVVSFGISPWAGVLALVFSTVGILSKFYAESIESIDRKPVEALYATGSHSLGVIRHAIVPQVLPLFMGYNLYLLDHNIRVAMALGVVGAGGLGVELYSQLRSFDYQKASATLIIIAVIITVIDRISAKLRKDTIEGKAFVLQTWKRDSFGFFAFLIVSALFLYFIPIGIEELQRGFGNVLSTVKQLLAPDFSDLLLYVKLMFETVMIAISGTFLAIVLSVPLGLLLARNLVSNPVIHNVVRELVNFLRAMPELVLALIFVAAVGLGPFSGVLAIALHTTGLMAKFYAESIENIDPKPVEATHAVGARLLHVIRHAVFPQIVPLFNSYNLYLLDRNIRASTVLGIVGAGGIGFELAMNIKLFEYGKVSSMILVILSTIFLVDTLSSYLRKRIV